jgi:ATP-dependent protease ClpP protease subunit
MSAEEAMAYGLIDKVFSARKGQESLVAAVAG